MPSQLIIKSHNPWKFWLKLILFATAFLLVAWGMYMYGQERAGYNNRLLQSEQRQLQEQIYQLGKLNSELREKSTVLERSSVIDRQAYEKVDTSIKTLQDEILELKEQVTFYRGIVSPKETAGGLYITSLKINTIDNQNSYRLKLVLTQLKNNQRMVRGNASLAIDGIINGEQKHLDLTDLIGDKSIDLKLHFKYFQTIEADIVFPDGFVPSSVQVDINPIAKGTSRIKKSFDWTDIVG